MSMPQLSDGGPPVSPISVFLLDDNEPVRHGVAELVNAEPDLEVTGQAGTVAEALHALSLRPPNVAVLDVRLSDGSGIDVCREIRLSNPEVACLIFTSFADRDWSAAFDAGAAGYLLKRLGSNELVDSIRVVASGRQLGQPGWPVG